MDWKIRTGVTAFLVALVAFGTRPAAGQGGSPPVPGDRLTLGQVLELARSRSPKLAATRSMAAAVGTRESWASLPPDPALQIGVMNFSLPEFRTDMPNSMAPSLAVSQMIPFPGKLGLNGRIAEQTTAIAEAGAEEAWWEIRSRAAMQFYELYEADRSIEVMRETLELLRDFEQVAKAMYSAGEGRQSDVLRANVEVARMDAEIRRMEAMRTASAARLNGILDRPADTPVPSPVLGALPADLPGADTLLAWADANRPMLAGGRLGIERAGTKQELARKQIWPDFMIGVQYGQRGGTMGTDRMASAMVGFSLPIFASKRQLRMRDEALAMEQMAVADLAEMRAMVDARIGELLADLDRDRSLVGLYRSEVLPQAEANVESAFSSYRVGAVDFMTLVDSRMTVNRYEIELIALLADYGRAVADLETAVGREMPRSDTMLSEDR